MYVASAAATKQGKAISDAAALWGDRKGGIAFPVCKRKFQPVGSSSCQYTGERMYGCHIHHLKRKARVCKAGYREGWVDFEDLWPVVVQDEAIRKNKRQKKQDSARQFTTSNIEATQDRVSGAVGGVSSEQ